MRVELADGLAQPLYKSVSTMMERTKGLGMVGELMGSIATLWVFG